jgi:hypothetical protein
MAQTDPQTTSAIVAGIIAIVSGVLTLIATLVTTYLLRNAGKLIINVHSSSFGMYKSNSMGGEQQADSLVDAEALDYSYELDFFNTSDVPKSLRTTIIECVPRNIKKTILLPILTYKKGENSTLFSSYFEELHIINLPSKVLIHLKLSGRFKKEDIQFLRGKVDFYFKGKYPNGKTFRKKLITQDF